jgi:hypothetical protein
MQIQVAIYSQHTLYANFYTIGIETIDSFDILSKIFMQNTNSETV